MPKTILDPNKPIIQLKDVGLRYNAGNEILKNIDLEIKPGEFYFLTGPSGAGKTSLLKLIHLAHKPTRGTVKIFNHNIDYIKQQEMAMIRRKIGIVFQDYYLLNHLSVFDNIALPLRIIKKNEKYIYNQVTNLVNWIGLKNYINIKPPFLSGGQQQRIAIARAIINQPSILIADEPTGNVDEEMAKKLLLLFLELNKKGTTVIIATHSNNLIQQFKFPILHLEHGYLTKELR